VIASLVYLATQIRQNTTTVRHSAASSFADASFTLNAFLAQEDVNRIFWAGLAPCTLLQAAQPNPAVLRPLRTKYVIGVQSIASG
jgi:hypothetical protein